MEQIGAKRRASNAADATRVPDSVAVVSPFPAEPGYGRPSWARRLRSLAGLGGMVILGGVLGALAVAATLLALAIFVATAFG